MFNISNFLAKFQKVGEVHFATRDAAAKVLSSVIGIPVLSKDIQIKKRTLTLVGASAMLRSQLFMKKAQLLKELKEACGDAIQDIR